MNKRDNASQTVQLTATEVAIITRPMTLDLGEASVFQTIRPASASNSADFASRSITNYSLAALAFYALISFVQTVLDIQHVDGGLQTQFVHYALTDFWLNISGALLLAAWTMVDRGQPHRAGDLSRS